MLALLGAAVVASAACFPQGELTEGLAPITTGSLRVGVEGLPAGTPASVTVTSVQGFQSGVTATKTITGLTPGSYTIAAGEVSSDGDRYAPAPTSQSVTIVASPTPTFSTVAYVVVTGRLRVTVAGAPAGSTPSIEITGPGDYHHTSTVSETLTGLVAGSYQVRAASLVASGDRYDPQIASQDILVTPGSPAPAEALVTFAIASGRLVVTVGGLPSGATPVVQVTGPGGFSSAITRTDTLTGLTPGQYAVAASPVTWSGNSYAPTPVNALVPVVIAPTPVSAAVGYALASGALQVTVSGLPGGASAAVSVSGPQGFSAVVATTTTLTGLVPGLYSVTSATAVAAGQTYVPAPAVQNVVISASLVPEQCAVTYMLGQGSLAVVVSGLPAGVGGSIAVSGPGGYSMNLTGSQTLGGLVPGSYTVSASGVSDGTLSYAPSPSAQTVAVTIGGTSVAPVGYAVSSGVLAVTVAGLPGGQSANVTVTGPGAYSQPITASQTLTGLAPGSYTITASSVSAGSFSYGPTPGVQGRIVPAGATATATVTYAPVTGNLSVTVNGLPGGTNANITVTGPAGFSQMVTASQTFTGLTPGSYTVVASSVVSGATTYSPTPVSQSAGVSAGGTAGTTVTYSGSGGGASLNLTVNGVYLTQATQKYDGTVPLVAGRDAYVRVFAVANQANTAQPQVRVRLYSGLTLLQTLTIAAPAGSVPTAVNEGGLTSSWNVMVPGSLVQPNLKVLADVDPAGGVAESDETDNRFPTSGTPGAVDVRTLPSFMVRFIPVLQQVNGLQGDVTAGNQESFLNDLKKLLPVGSYDGDLRAAYTTSAPVLQNDNTNGAWGTVLSELLSLRFAEGSTRYYYGVVKTSYTSGVAGIGYVGGSAHTALGWDRLPSGSGVMAHELGHNMGRQHAPCGGVAGPDPAFPYAGGKIGVWGLDLTTLALKSPATYADLMGYCSPVWVSDYTWSGMLSYRESGASNAPPAAPGSGEGLLIWGRITERGVVLEPAFTVAAAPALAPVGGAHRLELARADGAVLRTVSFDAPEVADLPGGAERHFAFVVPLDPQLRASLGQLTVRAGGRSATRFAAPAATGEADPAPIVTRPNAQQVEVRWNAASYPMVMVRDVATGQVLSFARGGSARLWSRAGAFDLQFSDGVKSVVRQRRPLQ